MLLIANILQFVFRLVFLLPAGPALAVMGLAAWKLQLLVRLTPFRRTVEENLRLVFPDRDCRRLANDLIRNFCRAIFEVICLPFLGPEHFRRIVEHRGVENLELALREKKGAIILVLHAGNYELVPASLAGLGFRFTAILRATGDQLFKFVNRSRSAGGVKLVNVMEANMYQASLQALADNELVYLLADTGALESRHEYLNFLGRQVPVATGWLTLAQRSGCRIIPTLTWKKGPQNVYTFTEPLQVTRENRDQVKARIGAIFDRFIRENPEQWAMFLNSYETKRMIRGD